MSPISHGPRSLPRKPGAVRVPLPLVHTEKSLVEAIHRHIWQCVHPADEKLAPQCEVLAEQLMEDGCIVEASEFLSSLKDNEKVQQIVKDAMAAAWLEGVVAKDEDVNPYG